MGRGGGQHKKRLLRKDYKGEGRRENQWNEAKTHRADKFLEAGDLHNEAFEEYYKAQDIVPPGEWEAFVEVLKKPLPITFRINGSGRFANELREKLESDFFSQFAAGPIMLDGEVVDPPRPLPWYPSNLAWHMNFSRNQLRKLSWLAQIHAFMKTANEAGSITRQEAVSMVPPLFMDVKPHHRVLDMCAAPGSKTFQLLEMLHAVDPSSDSSSSSLTPSGIVVANDADAQRCCLLTHQTKRMCSPCLMITNHNGQEFPRISAAAAAKPAPGSTAAAAAAAAAAVGAAAGDSGDSAPPAGGRVAADDVMLFDRILCDVPCSGDGTMRKAPDIWRRWTVNNGNGLHNLQLRIALQAVRLLKVGGRMVYSTCTFNPIEDEAVVAELLVRAGGALELLDVSDQLAALVRCPGKRSWLVRDKFQWYKTWEEAEKVGFKLDPSMFSSPEKQQLPMERCMRILPHHQDTGGFFVAVLQKVAPTHNLTDPAMTHRYSRIVASGRDGRLVKVEGADFQQGVATAAECALQAAERAVAALESEDLAAAAAAGNAAAAAHAHASLALEAASDTYKHQRRYDAQEERKQQQQVKRQQQQQQGQAAVVDDEAAAAVAGDDMEGVEAAGDDEGAAAADDDMAVDEAAAAAAAAEGDEEAAAAAAAAEGDEEAAAAAAGPSPGSQDAAGDGGGAAGGVGGGDKPAWTPSWVRGGGGRGRSGGEGGRFRGIDPILPVEDPDIIQMLVDFYGVESSFPLATHLITRSLEATFPKRLYYVSDSLLSLLLADTRESLKIPATGLKLFERHELRGKESGKCQYRIAQEGLPFLLPHLTKQVLHLGVADFMRLLTEKNLPLLVSTAAAADGGDDAAAANGAAAAAAAATGVAKFPSNQQPLTTPAVVQQLEAVESGGAVAVLEEEDARKLGLATAEEAAGALTVNAPLAISVWRTRASLSVLVAKNECEQLVEKIKGAQQRQAAGKQEHPAAAAAAAEAK